jgi:energy-coupling factor transporter ATP-binding protein EcfA2
MSTPTSLGAEPLIEAHKPEKFYPPPDGTRIRVISPTDMAVDPGQIIAPLGPSGCAKSTMRRMLTGLLARLMQPLCSWRRQFRRRRCSLGCWERSGTSAFNVIAGTMAIPTDRKEVVEVFRFSRFVRWRRLILPGICLYLVTGMVAASDGAWNASWRNVFIVKGKWWKPRGWEARSAAPAARATFACCSLRRCSWRHSLG